MYCCFQVETKPPKIKLLQIFATMPGKNAKPLGDKGKEPLMGYQKVKNCRDRKKMEDQKKNRKVPKIFLVQYLK